MGFWAPSQEKYLKAGLLDKTGGELIHLISAARLELGWSAWIDSAGRLHCAGKKRKVLDAKMSEGQQMTMRLPHNSEEGHSGPLGKCIPRDFIFTSMRIPKKTMTMLVTAAVAQEMTTM